MFANQITEFLPVASAVERRGFAAAASTVHLNEAAVGNTQWFDGGQVPVPPFVVLSRPTRPNRSSAHFETSASANASAPCAEARLIAGVGVDEHAN